jgi:hypothetical protein
MWARTSPTIRYDSHAVTSAAIAMPLVSNILTLPDTACGEATSPIGAATAFIPLATSPLLSAPLEESPDPTLA